MPGDRATERPRCAAARTGMGMGNRSRTGVDQSHPPKPPSLRRNMAYAAVGRGIHVATQFGLIAVVAQLGTPADVGALTLAAAIVTPLFFLTSMGLRDVHTVDDLTLHSRADYVALRLVGGAVAVALSMACVLALYGPAQTLVVAAAAGFALVKFFGAQTSLNHGVFQRAERLDFVALSNLARGGGGFLAFAAVFAATRDLPLALFAEAAVWFVSYFVVDQPLLRRVGGTTAWRELAAVRLHAVLRLLWWLLPVGLALWFLRAATSAPPIVLARHVDLDTVGIFGAIAYVYSALAMASGTIGGAAAARLRRHYRSGGRRAFVRLVLRLSAVSATAGAVGLAGAAVLGEAVLGLAFGEAYRRGDLLLIVVLAAAIGLAAAPFVTGLQAGQAFRRRLIIGVAGFGAAWVAAMALVPAWGAQGAAWSLVVMALANAGATLVLFRGVLRDMPAPTAGEG